MPEHMGGEMVQLTFRAEPAEVPVWPRVRALLKHARRTLQLRCVEAVDVSPKLPPLPAAVAPTEANAPQDVPLYPSSDPTEQPAAPPAM
jgi:hypothetical protein